MSEDPQWTDEQANRLLDDVFFDFPVLTDEEIEKALRQAGKLPPIDIDREAMLKKLLDRLNNPNA